MPTKSPAETFCPAQPPIVDLSLPRWREKFGKGIMSVELQAIEEYGDIINMKFGRATWYFVVQPDFVETVLKNSHRSMRKGIFWNDIRQLAGNGIITSEPENWLAQRRSLQPIFLRRYHEQFAREVERGAGELVAEWQARAASAETIEVLPEMARLVLRNSGYTLFGTELSDLNPIIRRNLVLALEYLWIRNNIAPYKRALGAFVPGTRHWRFKQNLKELENIVEVLLDRHRKSKKFGNSDSPNLIDALIKSLEEVPKSSLGYRKASRYLRDQIIIFLFAANETTSVTTSWVWLMLAQHPEVEARLAQELKEVLKGRTPTQEDLPNLPYLDRVVSEALRLYPPIWNIWRETSEITTLGEFTLPKGVPLSVSPYLVHRNPKYWEDPETFDPDRFLPERSEQRHPFAYIPFGGGPRQCIGKYTALVEAKLIIATLAQHFTLKLSSESRVVPRLGITLAPSENLPMTVHLR